MISGEINPETHFFEHWTINTATLGSGGYIAGVDSLVKEQGKYSLFIEKNTAGKSGMVGSCINSFPVNFKGKDIELTAYIKTENVSPFAAIVIQVTDKNGKEYTNDLRHIQAVRGTTGWEKYSYKVHLNNNAAEIAIVPNLRGDGKVWFDNLKLYVGGVPYASIKK